MSDRHPFSHKELFFHPFSHEETRLRAASSFLSGERPREERGRYGSEPARGAADFLKNGDVLPFYFHYTRRGWDDL